MSQTPYAPPAARVSDPVERALPKPASVSRAVACLWICLALMIAMTAFQLPRIDPAGGLVMAVVTTLVTVGVVALIAIKAGAGRNWARWLFLVLFVIGTLMTGLSVVAAPQAWFALPALEQASMLVQFALQIASLVLLFTPASTQWFRSMKSS